MNRKKVRIEEGGGRERERERDKGTFERIVM